MKFLRELLFEMTSQEVNVSKDIIKRIFKPIADVDVRFGPHFKEDRLMGREESVTAIELCNAFLKARNKYGDMMFNIPSDKKELRWVIKDVELRLNIVIAIGLIGSTNKYYIQGITIMRKDTDKFLSNHAYTDVQDLLV